MKLISIIQKNFKIFIRSKVSALIIFLGPLLLVSLIGLSFSNTQLPGLTVGTYSPNYNEFTNSIIQKIEQNKFTIEKYNSRELCSDSVKKGNDAICLVFPENMDKNNNEVSFIVDYSKINLVFIVVDIFTSRISERATELRTSYATDLINKVVQTREDLNTEKTNLGTLSTKQTDSKSTLGGAQSTLTDIDPTTDFGDDFSIDTAKSSVNSVKSKVDSAKEKVLTARNAVEGSSLSETEKGAINDKLGDANSYLATAMSYLEGNSSVKSLEVILTSLNSALENAKLQLQTIKTKKTELQGDLATLDGTLSDSINSVNSITSAVADMISRIDSVQTSDAAQIVSPIRTKIEPVTTQETHFNYLFPTLIVLVIMITAVLLSSTFVMDEKKSKSVFRNFITPTSDVIFNLGTFITSFIAIFIQLIIFLLVSFFFFDTNIFNSIGSSLIILILVTTVFILLGMIIGYVFKSEETYVLAAITVSALLLFLSSTVMPIESISDSVRAFASYTPFVVSESLLRQAMFFHFSLDKLGIELLILAAYAVIFYGVIVAIQKLARYNISIVKRQKK